MIVLDANLLVYAYNTDSKEHTLARTYLESLLSTPEPVGIPLQNVLAFLRLSTAKGLWKAPYSVEEAAGFVASWFAQPQVRLLLPAERHWSLLKRMLIEGQATGGLVMDAAIAAIPLEYGGVLQTNDRNFARFPGLRWNNPLERA